MWWLILLLLKVVVTSRYWRSWWLFDEAFRRSQTLLQWSMTVDQLLFKALVVEDTKEFNKLLLKVCVRFFFIFFPPNDSFWMINAFYFIWKTLFILKILEFLYLSSHLFFPVGHCFRGWLKINLRAWQIACTVMSVHAKRLSRAQNYVHVNQWQSLSAEKLLWNIVISSVI